MKIYIAGPMSGYPDFNRPAFHSAAHSISSGGSIPLSPAILPDGLDEPDYMAICIAMLQRSDSVLMLPGWEKSAGAAAEHALAKKLGLIIRYL